MRTRCLACVGLVGVGIGLGAWVWTAAQTVPVEAYPSSSARRASDERRHAELHERYAAARLQLADASLAKARSLGRRIPRQVSQREFRSLERGVEILRTHVDVTHRHAHGNSYTLARCLARATKLQADEDLAAAHGANERHAGTVSPEAMGVLEARAEVAAARLVLWEDPAFLEAPLAVMQMQIDQLSDQMLELAQRIDNAPSVDRR
ncbi:MAG: hypothetical protein EBR23_09545 [Planctomycetia bacterium]|nr:hypothetical protein [Planctomycetia bacterium]